MELDQTEPDNTTDGEVNKDFDKNTQLLTEVLCYFFFHFLTTILFLKNEIRMNKEKIENDPSWQSGWEGWTEEEWKEPVRVELPESTVQESSLSHISAEENRDLLRRSETIESDPDTEDYDTAKETATDTACETANEAYETATETGFNTDVGETYFSANEDDLIRREAEITPTASPRSSSRKTPSPSSCIDLSQVEPRVILADPVDDEESQDINLERDRLPDETMAVKSDDNNFEEPSECMEKQLSEPELSKEKLTVTTTADETTLFRDGCTIIETSNTTTVEVFDPKGLFYIFFQLKLIHL